MSNRICATSFSPLVLELSVLPSYQSIVVFVIFLKVHPPRCQANEMGPTNHQSSHFTLPQWMASLNFMGQDQNSQISHSDYQEESAMQSNELSTVMKHGDGGKLDTSPTGYVYFVISSSRFFYFAVLLLRLSCSISM